MNFIGFHITISRVSNHITFIHVFRGELHETSSKMTFKVYSMKPRKIVLWKPLIFQHFSWHVDMPACKEIKFGTGRLDVADRCQTIEVVWWVCRDVPDGWISKCAISIFTIFFLHIFCAVNITYTCISAYMCILLAAVNFCLCPAEVSRPHVKSPHKSSTKIGRRQSLMIHYKSQTNATNIIRTSFSVKLFPAQTFVLTAQQSHLTYACLSDILVCVVVECGLNAAQAPR